MTRPLKSFIFDQINANGIVYFVLNYKGCVSHCRNQKRLHDEANDTKRQAAVTQYVNALFAAGDIR